MGVHDWVKPFCTKIQGDDGILDGFDNEFYIRFDCAMDDDNPLLGSSLSETCDILIVPVGNLPKDGAICVISNATQFHIAEFLVALGIRRFPESVFQEIWRIKKQDWKNGLKAWSIICSSANSVSAIE